MAGQPKTRAIRKLREENKKIRAAGGKPPRKKPAAKSAARRAPARKADLIHGHLPEAWAEFLRLYIQHARQDVACKKTGISRQTVYRRTQTDGEFQKLYAEAKRIGVGRLADEAVRRAVDGVEKPVFHRGCVVGHITEYSDSLLQFMLINSGDAQFKPVKNAGSVIPEEEDEANIDPSRLSKNALEELLNARRAARNAADES